MPQPSATFPGARICPFAPPPDYESFRDRPGLERVTIWDGSRPWLVARHADVRLVLSDPRFSADVRNPGFPLPSADKRVKEAGLFLRLDDPEHARHRRRLVGDFTVRAVAGLEGRAQAICHELLEAMTAAGTRGDLIRQYALPLPTRIICLLFGVPYEDHELVGSFTVTSTDLTASLEDKRRAADAQRGYFGALVAEKQRRPGDDLISRMLEGNGPEDRFTPDQVRDTAAILVSAGHETTANQIGLGVLTMLTHHETRTRFLSDRAATHSLVEEQLRYWSIVNGSPRRVALEDVEVGGQLVRTGEGLVISIAAANRDHAAFDDSEAPLDELHPDRPDLRTHVAFGFGIHQCLGQHLARLELKTAWQTLFETVPDLRLSVPSQDLEFKDENTMIFGLRSLPVAWGDTLGEEGVTR